MEDKKKSEACLPDNQAGIGGRFPGISTSRYWRVRQRDGEREGDWVHREELSHLGMEELSK